MGAMSEQEAMISTQARNFPGQTGIPRRGTIWRPLRRWPPRRWRDGSPTRAKIPEEYLKFVRFGMMYERPS